MRRIARALLGLVAAMPLVPSAAAALTCGSRSLDGLSYTVCEVDPRRDDLRLFHADAGGRVLGSFAAIEATLDAGARLAFAMNAGMYHPDRAPVGLYVEEGRQTMRAVASPGPGNFGLLPNGILCIGGGTARVWETLAFLEAAPDCRFATQSGPMLVSDGALHPRFLPDGTSRNIRNGVGTSADGSRVVFAISDQPVSFHEFARFFRDALQLPDALYLDGRVSRLHAPPLGRSDAGLAMGPIVGVVAQAPDAPAE